MGYAVKWYVNNEVLYVEMGERLTLEDLATGNHDIMQYMDDSPADRVHLLVNNSRLKQFPTDLGAIIHTTRLLRHPRCGMTVTYDQSNNRLIETISTLMYRIFNRRRYSASSREEALAYLRKTFPDVAWDRADASVFEEADKSA